MKDQPVGAQRNQDHRRDVADPGQREEWPSRQPQIESEHVVGARRPDLVVECEGLHRDHEQQNERCEYVDRALIPRAHIGIEKIDGNMGAAIGGGANSPEDQHAEQQAAEVVAVGNRDAEEIAQQHGHEDVGGDDADKQRGQKLDGIDEPIGEFRLHVTAPSPLI